MISIFDLCQITAEDLHHNCERRNWFLAQRKVHLDSALWIVPGAHPPSYGGVRTIIGFMRALADCGTVQHLVTYGDLSQAETTYAIILNALSPSSTLVHHHLSLTTMAETRAEIARIPPVDVAFATIWPAAYFLSYYCATKAKFYLMQDLESRFYPGGTLGRLANDTCYFNIPVLAYGPALHQAISKCGGMAVSYLPGLDHNLFLPPENDERFTSVPETLQIFVYGRPSIERNCFQYALRTAVAIDCRLRGRTEVWIAGEYLSEISPLPSRFHRMGRLTIESTANLYRRCHIGITFAEAFNPNYIVFELMGCGTVVASGINSSQNWILRDDHTALLAAGTELLADRVIASIQRPHILSKIAIDSQSLVAQLDWSNTFARLINLIISPQDFIAAAQMPVSLLKD